MELSCPSYGCADIVVNDARPTLDDWLELHRLSVAQARALVDRSGRIVAPAREVDGDSSISLTPDAVWQICATALRVQIPGAERVADATQIRVMVNTEPDRARHPRAFTLHNAGNGAPYVSCPWDGRIADAVTLAHEFGHAAQILASGDRELAPVLREACAHLSEMLFARQLIRTGHPQSDAVAGFARQHALAMAVHYGPRLRRSLAEASAQYEYGWNYPPALALADALFEDLNADTLWSLFSGRAVLPELIEALDL